MDASRDRMSDQKFGFVLLTPGIMFVLCIAIYPILRILWLSFQTQNLGTDLHAKFSGMDNYIRVINDGHFFQSIYTTCIFTFIAVSIELLLGLGFALLLNETFRGRGFVRACALIPWAMPTAVLALAWTWVFNDQFGIFNDLLINTGIISHPVVWLGGTTTAMFAVIFADVWKTAPFMMIILLAGMQNIRRDLYEAIQIDGAHSVKSFTLVTLPMLMPSITLALLFRIIQSFGIFDLVFVMTGGGPGNSTETVAIYTYNTFLRYLDFGYGAAMIIVTFFIMAGLSLAIYWPLKRFNQN